MGLQPTQPEAKHCAGDYRTFLLVTFAIILLICSLLGYLLTISALRQPKGHKEICNWNWYKIFKLVIEDFMSIFLTILVIFFCTHQITYEALISLIVSSLSYLFFMFKETFLNPIRISQPCHEVCGIYMCCLYWVAIYM